MIVVLLVIAATTAFWVWTSVAHSRSGGYKRGMASGMDITTSMSAAAVRRGAYVTRPTKVTTRRTPTRHVGIELGWVRWLGVLRRGLYVGFREIVLVISPPGAGKTGALAGAVQDAPGAVIAASSRSDLYENTKASRGRRRIRVFNPDRIGGVDSDVRFSPVIGCRAPRYAMLMAALLVSAGDTEDMKDGKFWESNAVRALRSFLAAADVAGLDMHAVTRWSDLADDEPVRLLRQHKKLAPPGWAADLEKLQAGPEGTVKSVATTLATALKFMADPLLAWTATPDASEHFDTHGFYRAGEAFYIIGRQREHDPVGPLFAALTGILFETGVELAERSPGKRLDPPGLLVLDEVTNIFRLAVDIISSYAGGSGLPMVIAAQGHHQLRKAFGDEGAKAIWSNAAAKLVFGGDMDRETLDDLSALCGTRAAERGAHARRPVLLPEDILRLPDGHVLVLRKNTPPVIARSRPVWERRHPPVAEPLVTPAETPQEPRLRLVVTDEPDRAA